ncbi:glycosyltransferase family 4 protein [Dyadobacter flavalbus]|uniref:glycosyltransferase family 4 protein n=1 Tax=Dyadobacter flavalbus TaxID=2579942 RepID=UPI001375C5E0|nr:glycosyltransferase family 4 protein [Dyadobacter flavalbus]
MFKTLKELDFDILVLTNKSGIAPEALHILDKCSIRHEEITYPSWSDIRKPHTLPKVITYISKVILHNIHFILKYFRYRPDYIYIASDFMYLNLIPSFICIPTKIIYRIGDAPLVGWKPFKYLWKKYITLRTYRFVCISGFIRNKVSEAGRSYHENDMVIYNYPPVRNDQEVTSKINYKKNAITFSYLGQLIYGKGVHLIIDAALVICNKYQNVNFIIAGSLEYDKRYSNELVQKVNNSKFKERILFLGPIGNTEDFFTKTDVIITPSLKEEPLGNVIVEAKSCATPSIIFNSGGMPELIKHKQNGFICQESTKEGLVEAIEYYIENPDAVKIQSSNALNSINELKINYQDFKNNWKKAFS